MTYPSFDGWEAIAEVKGYPRGTKTSDSRQIREQRERYRDDEGRFPDQTLWIANTHKRMDPSCRPVPGTNVHEAAANIGAVHILATDLYRLWARVEAGDMKPAQAAEQLVRAEAGVWHPQWPEALTSTS